MAYVLHITIRYGQFEAPQCCRQFTVDQYCKIETERPIYGRSHLISFTVRVYGNLCDALMHDQAPNQVGWSVILPSSLIILILQLLRQIQYTYNEARMGLHNKQPSTWPRCPRQTWHHFLSFNAASAKKTWQNMMKRGLPHSHSLVWLAPANNVRTDDVVLSVRKYLIQSLIRTFTPLLHPKWSTEHAVSSITLRHCLLKGSNINSKWKSKQALRI